jgi:phage gpG-like protein
MKQIPDFVSTLKTVEKKKREKYLIEVKERLQKSVEDNFEKQGRYQSLDSLIGGSKKWDKYKTTNGISRYKIWKRQNGYGSKIGTRTGALKGSIKAVVDSKNTNITIQSDITYAKYFDKRRPFMVIQPSDIAFIKRIAKIYIKETLDETKHKARMKAWGTRVGNK